MEHIYPTFERGRILKNESLWALRDYSYTALEMQYLKFVALDRQEQSDCIQYPAQIRLEVEPLQSDREIIKEAYGDNILQEETDSIVNHEIEYFDGRK